MEKQKRKKRKMVPEKREENQSKDTNTNTHQHTQIHIIDFSPKNSNNFHSTVNYVKFATFFRSPLLSIL